MFPLFVKILEKRAILVEQWNFLFWRFNFNVFNFFLFWKNFGEKGDFSGKVSSDVYFASFVNVVLPTSGTFVYFSFGAALSETVQMLLSESW